MSKPLVVWVNPERWVYRPQSNCLREAGFDVLVVASLQELKESTELSQRAGEIVTYIVHYPVLAETGPEIEPAPLEPTIEALDLLRATCPQAHCILWLPNRPVNLPEDHVTAMKDHADMRVIMPYSVTWLLRETPELFRARSLAASPR